MRADRLVAARLALQARSRVQLVGAARTDLSGLTAAEGQALFVLAGPAGRLSPDVRSALRKLVRALPKTFQADAETAGAVVLDPAAWGSDLRDRPESVDVPQQAVVVYTSRVAAERLVEKSLLPWVRRQVWRQRTVVGQDGDRLELAASTAEMLARQVAGWGVRAEMLELPEVRAHLARLGREVGEHYG